MDVTETRTRAVPEQLQRWLPRRRAADETVELPQGVRRRRQRDLGVCVTLVHRAFFEGQFPGHRPAEPAAWLADVISAFVAERDGEIVGHVAVACAEVHGETGLRWREMTGHPAEELGVVGQLFVRPRFRGHGIGTSLVTTAIADARARGLVPVLEVVTHERLAPPLAHGHGWRLRSSEPFPQW